MFVSFAGPDDSANHEVTNEGSEGDQEKKN